MKKVFSFLIVMAFVFSAVAQDANVEKQKKVKEPEITFETLTHDYGNILQGDNGTCEFVFKNTGKADLLLTNCRSSCGCTATYRCHQQDHHGGVQCRQQPRGVEHQRQCVTETRRGCSSK